MRWCIGAGWCVEFGHQVAHSAAKAEDGGSAAAAAVVANAGVEAVCNAGSDRGVVLDLREEWQGVVVWFRTAQ